MQLGKLLEKLYIRCGLQVLRRSATGGSATTVVDSGIANKKGDGFYAQGVNGGYILFIAQTTDRLSPEGKFGEVSAFTLSTSTPTFTIPTVTDAVGSGDIYAVMKPTIQLYEMIEAINTGLNRMPALELKDTSLTWVSGTIAYNLPLAVGAYPLLGVEIGDDTNGWRDADGFSITPNSGSTQNQLVFSTHPPRIPASTIAGNTIKIRYLAKHPLLSIYSDYIEKSVPDELAIAVCTAAAWELLMRKRPSYFTDKTKFAEYQDIQTAAQRAIMENPIHIKPATRMPRFHLSEL